MYIGQKMSIEVFKAREGYSVEYITADEGRWKNMEITEDEYREMLRMLEDKYMERRGVAK